MTVSGATGPEPGQAQWAAFLELLFDLVFIFALAQLSQGLIEHLDWTSALHTLILLMALWWLWTLTVWTTGALDTRRPAVQLQVVAVMFGSLVIGIAIPHAFDGQGLIFAATYVSIHICVNTYYGLLLRGHEQQARILRALFWFGVSALPWIGGALVHGVAREVLWTFAVALDYIVAVIRRPTPGFGREPADTWRLTGQHASERYRQFLVIALGETVLVTGLTFSTRSPDVGRAIALATSFATTVMLGRIYIYRAGELLGSAIDTSPEPSRPGQWTAHIHLVMVAGIVLTAVGDGLVVAHPTGQDRPAWIGVIVGGPALFLAGRALLDYAVFGQVFRSRPLGILLLATLAPATFLVAPVAAAIATTLVLACVAVADVAAWRTRPRKPMSPIHKGF